MEKTFVCDIPEQEANDFLGVFEMKSTLENLVLLIAENNDILKKESSLYKRLIEDYKETLIKHEKFWAFYTEKYGYLLSENTQFTLDCRTNKIFLVPTDA